MRFKYYLRGAGIGVIVATLILSVAFLFQDSISDEEVIRRAMKLGMIMEENEQGTLDDMQLPGDSSTGLQDGSMPDDDALSQPEDTSADIQNTKADDTGTGSEDPDSPDDENTQAGESGTPDGEAAEPGGAPDSEPSGGKKDEDSTDKPSSEKEPDKKPSSEKDKDKDKENGDGKTEEDKKPSGSGNGTDEAGTVVITIESGDVSRMVSAKVFEAGLVESADEFNSYLGEHDYDNKLQPGRHRIPKGSDFAKIAQILTTRE